MSLYVHCVSNKATPTRGYFLIDKESNGPAAKAMMNNGGTQSRFQKSCILLACITSSLMLSWLATPSGPAPILVFVALSPVLAVLGYLRPRGSGVVLYFSAVGWWLIASDALPDALVKFVGLGRFSALFFTIIFAAIQALPYFFIGWAIRTQYDKQGQARIIFATTIYVVILYWFPTFILGHQAYSLHSFPSLIQAASLGGNLLILAFVVATNLNLANLANRIARKQNKRYVPVIHATISIIGLYAAGQLAQLPNTKPLNSAQHTLGFVQPSFIRTSNISSLLVETARLQKENPDIEMIVWPELPNHFSYTDDATDKLRVNQLSKLVKTNLLLASGYEFDDKQPNSKNYFNSVHLLNADGSIEETYRKQKLVPFFEYLPYESEIPKLRFFFPETLLYMPGKGVNRFTTSSGLSFSVAICFEAIFPSHIRENLSSDALLLVNVSNDGWFGNSIIASYHFAMAKFRAVENRVSLLRVTNSGISAFVDPFGNEQAKSVLGYGEIGSRAIKIGSHQVYSWYRNNGDVLLHLTTLITLFVSALKLRKNRAS